MTGSSDVRRPHGGRSPRGGPYRAEASTVTGITALMNRDNVRPGADLSQAEARVLGRASPAGGRAKSDDAARMFSREIENLADELGLKTLLDPVEDAPPEEARPASPPSRRASPPPDPFGFIGRLDRDADDSDASESQSSLSSRSSWPSRSSRSASSGDADSVVSDVGRRLRTDPERLKRHGDRAFRLKQPDGYGLGSAPRREEYADDERTRVRQLDSVLGGFRQEMSTSLDADRARTQDLKAQKLESIAQLRASLEEEGIDCSGVAAPTLEASMEDVDSALTTLKLKNDRTRFSTLAEEVAVGLAEFLGATFDGSREIPVLKIKPDYRGYQNTVRLKLMRMRRETAEIVGAVLGGNRCSPLTQILVELAPSLVLYPYNQSKMRAAPGLGAELGTRTPARDAYTSIVRAEAERAAQI